ncbi:nuclear transport factor 2 family protein [Mycobacterium sp. NBC_00419]|uniref:nuclear transport factor 2 family protein n=1 Tax=Mycobacterium sp. NBC_00419 TaxID=2975989 RepID=UPI002E1F2DBF
MTAPVIERWLRFIENGQTDELDDLLAEDAVFYSPAVFTPQHGREKTAAYLRAAEKLFSHSNFRYVEKWIESRSAVLEFAAEVDGLTLEGVDIIRWNDDGKIVSFTVMIRPLKALQAIVPRMGELLLTS